MRIYEIPIGATICRKFWESRKLCIIIKKDGPYYINHDGKVTKARDGSTCYDHSDYYIIKEGTEMCKANYDVSTIMVLDNKGTMMSCETEEEAYEKIQDMLDNDPKRRFKMFKAYQVIEPKRVDLRGMIKSLVS